MKETSVGVGTSVECASVECPGLSWYECLVEDTVADRYDQRLEALCNWDGDGVAAERVGQYSVVGDCDLCALLDGEVAWEVAPACTA